MQFSKSKEMQEEELRKKIEEKETEIVEYLTSKDLRGKVTTKNIKKNIKRDRLKEKLDSGVDMGLVFYLLTRDIENSIKEHVGMKAFKKVCFRTSTFPLELI